MTTVLFGLIFLIFVYLYVSVAHFCFAFCVARLCFQSVKTIFFFFELIDVTIFSFYFHAYLHV